MPTLKPRRRPKIIRVPASSAEVTADQVVSATSSAATAAGAVPVEAVSSLDASGRGDSSGHRHKKRQRRPTEDFVEREEITGKDRGSSRLPLARPRADPTRGRSAGAASSNKGTGTAAGVSHVGKAWGLKRLQGKLVQIQKMSAASTAASRASFLHCSMMNAAMTMALAPASGFAASQAWTESNATSLAGAAAAAGGGGGGGDNATNAKRTGSKVIFGKGRTTRGKARTTNDLTRIMEQSRRISDQSEANMIISQLPYIYVSMLSQAMVAAQTPLNPTSSDDGSARKRKSSQGPDTL